MGTPFSALSARNRNVAARVHSSPQPESSLAWRLPQYRKALKASFPPDRWPATEITESDDSVRCVLKDGTEIHRIGILAEVYDYQTGKLVGHVGPRGRFVPLAADPAVEAATSKGSEVEILDD